MPSPCSAEIETGSPKPRSKASRAPASPALPSALLATSTTGLSRRRRTVGEQLVQRRDALAGVDHEQRHVGLVDGQLGLAAHARLQALVGDVLEAGGVDQVEVEIAQPAGGEAAVAGDAGPVVDDGQLVARPGG